MIEISSRLIEKTSILKTGCWMYLGGWNKSGYGNIWDNGCTRSAHVVSFECHVGPVPKGVCVLHTCDNRWCVNPKHLFLGTDQDNVDDMVQKGRDGFRGERNGRAKLTVSDVAYVLGLLDEGILSQEKIAAMFKVSRSTIAAIKSGRNWRQQ